METWPETGIFLYFFGKNCKELSKTGKFKTFFLELSKTSKKPQEPWDVNIGSYDFFPARNLSASMEGEAGNSIVFKILEFGQVSYDHIIWQPWKSK